MTGVIKDGMFCSQPFFAIVKGSGLLCRVKKGFHSANRITFVGVRGRVFQGIDPVPGEDSRILFRARLGGGDDGAAWLFERLHCPTTGASGIDDKLTAGCDAIAHGGDLGRSYVGSWKIEFVFDAIEGAV